MADVIYLIANGNAPAYRLRELIYDEIEVDDRTGDEIAEDIINKWGLKVV